MGATIATPYQWGLEGYKYEHYPAAMFAAFSPILWGIFMCVSHWAIVNDYAGEYFCPYIGSYMFEIQIESSSKLKGKSGQRISAFLGFW